MVDRHDSERLIKYKWSLNHKFLVHFPWLIGMRVNWQGGWLTDGQTFAILESFSRLKMFLHVKSPHSTMSNCNLRLNTILYPSECLIGTILRDWGVLVIDRRTFAILESLSRLKIFLHVKSPNSTMSNCNLRLNTILYPSECLYQTKRTSDTSSAGDGAKPGLLLTWLGVSCFYSDPKFMEIFKLSIFANYGD